MSSMLINYCMSLHQMDMGFFYALKVKCVIFDVKTLSTPILKCRLIEFDVRRLVYPTSERWGCLRITHFTFNCSFGPPPLVPAARYIQDYLGWSRWNETERAARRERTKRTAPGRHSPDNDNIRLLFSQRHSGTNSRPLELNGKGARNRKHLNARVKIYNMSDPERRVINSRVNQSFSTHTVKSHWSKSCSIKISTDWLWF